MRIINGLIVTVALATLSTLAWPGSAVAVKQLSPKAVERPTMAPVKPGVSPNLRQMADQRVDVEKWPNGNVRKRTPYKSGKIDGNVEEFFQNGNPAKVTPYHAGTINGEVVEYWDIPQVAVQSRITYVNGVKNGPAKNWHHNGKLLSERTYKNDKLDGPEVQYHPTNGKKKVERYWINGLQDSGEYHYDDQGRELSYFSYENGKKHGMAASYGFSHETRWQEEWNHGALVERVEFDYFNLAGGVKKLKQVETYNNAHKLHGPSNFFSAPDIPEKSLQYKNGKLDGECKYYDSAGKLERTEIWSNGSKVSEQQEGPRKTPYRR